MRYITSTIGLCCALALGATPALAADTLPTGPTTPAPLARPGATGDWVSLSGTVRSVTRQHFILDTGASLIPVDMDGYAIFDVRPGEQVTVTGRMQKPLTDHRLLNAKLVRVPSRNQRFWANPSDDGGGTYAFAPDATAPAGRPMTLTGTVVNASAPDAFTVATDSGTYAVDGSDIAASFRSRPVLIGDRVSVSGRLDTSNLFDRRQIDALSVTVIAPNPVF